MTGGRPRDPELDDRVVGSTITILATFGRRGLTMEDVAAAAECGKASIYRRWTGGVDELLVDVLTTLGTPAIAFTMTPGTLTGDLVDLIAAATTGHRAAAEAAMLCELSQSRALRDAYLAGPLTRLVAAIDSVAQRARRRGEGEFASIEPIRAAVAYTLQHRLVTGVDPRVGDIAHLVDVAVAPALRYHLAVPA